MSEENFTEGATDLASKTDANLALIILVATVVVVIVVALYIRKNQSTGGNNRLYGLIRYFDHASI